MISLATWFLILTAWLQLNDCASASSNRQDRSEMADGNCSASGNVSDALRPPFPLRRIVERDGDDDRWNGRVPILSETDDDPTNDDYVNLSSRNGDVHESGRRKRSATDEPCTKTTTACCDTDDGDSDKKYGFDHGQPNIATLWRMNAKYQKPKHPLAVQETGGKKKNDTCKKRICYPEHLHILMPLRANAKGQRVAGGGHSVNVKQHHRLHGFRKQHGSATEDETGGNADTESALNDAPKRGTTIAVSGVAKPVAKKSPSLKDATRVDKNRPTLKPAADSRRSENEDGEETVGDENDRYGDSSQNLHFEIQSLTDKSEESESSKKDGRVCRMIGLPYALHDDPFERKVPVIEERLFENENTIR